ncbi:MAG: hypothetical protein N2Z62_16695 [Rhodobacteraceae bacterium]|nr:hypothetical protein [Paracoccaceae bacterium]
MRASDEIRDALEEVVRQELPASRIRRVEVEEGEDHDGDASLFVTIRFDGEPRDLEVSKLTGLTRRLRSRLSGMGEHRFPYTRFISTSEAGEAA